MAKATAGRPALDGNAVRTQRTRERILAVSLGLFNDRGEANVTTGMIADELNISPGNLYYHFRNKDQIVERLFDRFEERISIAPPEPMAGAGAIEDLWLYLHLMFEAIWDYRFLYRNLDDIVGRNRRLREHFGRIVETKLGAVEGLCRGLADSGLMNANAGEIRALSLNVLVVATYWLNFRAVRNDRESPDPADPGTGAFQVMSLVAPYLAGEARRHFQRLGRGYIE
ncbi:MAG TPA: TetR/AcrR family transcriptional regulator [Usitatibacteraceae bacterium]|nr:TetR/AcrR family transcriptional regulator [Usitatibacteraceae bacterium]